MNSALVACWITRKYYQHLHQSRGLRDAAPMFVRDLTKSEVLVLSLICNRAQPVSSREDTLFYSFFSILASHCCPCVIKCALALSREKSLNSSDLPIHTKPFEHMSPKAALDSLLDVCVCVCTENPSSALCYADHEKHM